MRYLTAQKGLAQPLIFVIIIVLAIAGYFGYTQFKKPEVVKENVPVIQSSFEDYSDEIEKFLEDFANTDITGNSDVESLKREIEDTEDDLDQLEDNGKKIKSGLSALNYFETNEYKKQISSYLSKSDKIISYNKESIRVFKEILPAMEKMEDIQVSLSGVSNYIYSDPARFTTEIDKVIDDFDEIGDDLDKVETEDPDLKEAITFLVKTIELTKDLYKTLNNAVKNRDNNGLVESQKKFAEDFKAMQKNFDRAEDVFKDKYKAIGDELEDIKDKVNEQHDSLQKKFSF